MYNTIPSICDIFENNAKSINSRLNFPFGVFLPSLHLFQTDKCGGPYVVLLQILHTFLGGCHSINHDMVQRSTRSRYRNVVFHVNSSKVPLKQIQKIDETFVYYSPYFHTYIDANLKVNFLINLSGV